MDGGRGDNGAATYADSDSGLPKSLSGPDDGEVTEDVLRTTRPRRVLAVA